VSGFLPEEQKFLDEAVARLRVTRRTFTDRDALDTAWQAGCEDLTLDYDQRFVKAQARHGQYDPHYRLQEHILANNRLLNDLLDGSWDGLYLDARLETLDASEGSQHIFYPHDPRLRQNRQGRWEATVERTITLGAQEQAELDALAPALLAAWSAAGAQPWTIQEITAALKQPGWTRAGMPNAMLVMRAWLLGSPLIARVGQDFWLPTADLPAPVTRTRLQVAPVRVQEQTGGISEQTDNAAQISSAHHPLPPDKANPDEVWLTGEALGRGGANWTVSLRTVHLLEGFLPIPPRARNAYPPVVPGEDLQSVFDAMWTREGEHFWLWLDRQHHRFYGPALAEKIAYEDPGDVLHITWGAESIVVQSTGLQNEQVKREEARLIDVEALKELRANLGESYQRGIQNILLASPEGLPWQEIHIALSQRQQHEVHRGTILALLQHGGFIQRDKRWFAAPDGPAAQRALRTTLRQAHLPQSEAAHEKPSNATITIRSRAQVIKQRLEEISQLLG
jgi:hypothetical protein